LKWKLKKFVTNHILVGKNNKKLQPEILLAGRTTQKIKPVLIPEGKTTRWLKPELLLGRKTTIAGKIKKDIAITSRVKTTFNNISII
jgi:hypothetical protein